ncbi:hypothetical protein F66182_1604 [Fusarium sp. NRRL 66182]|nr:hypothetical protein F66182_1604 [Fusarium sp. NRRL 66182]
MAQSIKSRPIGPPPLSTQDGTKLAYFRGRKLQGKVVKLPEQCRGIVVERIPEKDPKTLNEEPIEDVDAEQEQAGSMQITAEFDEMVVWGHESIADASADPYVRSMEEWLQVADRKLHRNDPVFFKRDTHQLLLTSRSLWGLEFSDDILALGRSGTRMDVLQPFGSRNLENHLPYSVDA